MEKTKDYVQKLSILLEEESTYEQGLSLLDGLTESIFENNQQYFYKDLFDPIESLQDDYYEYTPLLSSLYRKFFPEEFLDRPTIIINDCLPPRISEWSNIKNIIVSNDINITGIEHLNIERYLFYQTRF